MGLSAEARWEALRALTEEADDEPSEEKEEPSAHDEDVSNNGWEALRALAFADDDTDAREDPPRTGLEALRALVAEEEEGEEEEQESACVASTAVRPGAHAGSCLASTVFQPAAGSGRFGLGRLEVEFSDSEDESEMGAAQSTAAPSSRRPVAPGGWAGLQTLVDQEWDDESDAVDVGKAAAFGSTANWEALRRHTFGCESEPSGCSRHDGEPGPARSSGWIALHALVLEDEREERAEAQLRSSGRFGLGALELEPLDDDDDDDDWPLESRPSSAADDWDALRETLGEDISSGDDIGFEDEEEEEEDEEEDECMWDEEIAMEEDRLRSAKAKCAASRAASSGHHAGSSHSLGSTPSTSELRSRFEASLLSARRPRALSDESGREPEASPNSSFVDGPPFSDGAREEDEEPFGDDSKGGISDDATNEEAPSDDDQLDEFRKGDSRNNSYNSDRENEHRRGESDGAGFSLLSGFSGGSLHAADTPRRRTSTVSLKEKVRPERNGMTGIRVVFPSLIWRGKGIMVLNKPADWICSASDVHRKMGRPDDPLEKVSYMNFATLDDLLKYKFRVGDKKYIHWWIQLIHDLDKKSYPNLFDIDQNYGLCHRLDRETSGAILVGLTQSARTQMRACFHRHFVRKLYVCLVHGRVKEREQTIDKNLESWGRRVRLSHRGHRARTHVKALAYFTKLGAKGFIEDYTLCTCEIAEGRMHQIRIHMSEGIGHPIVSELFYQDRRQMSEDRAWCSRVFLHAYAVGFPDVTGSDTQSSLRSVAANDMDQEWHCCICPLTVDLREVLALLEPRGEAAEDLKNILVDRGVLSDSHQIVHCRGTESRQREIDETYFPWSSVVNPFNDSELWQPTSRRIEGRRFRYSWRGPLTDRHASDSRVAPPPLARRRQEDREVHRRPLVRAPVALRGRFVRSAPPNAPATRMRDYTRYSRSRSPRSFRPATRSQSPNPPSARPKGLSAPPSARPKAPPSARSKAPPSARSKGLPAPPSARPKVPPRRPQGLLRRAAQRAPLGGAPPPLRSRVHAPPPAGRSRSPTRLVLSGGPAAPLPKNGMRRLRRSRVAKDDYGGYGVDDDYGGYNDYGSYKADQVSSRGSRL